MLLTKFEMDVMSEIKYGCTGSNLLPKTVLGRACPPTERPRHVDLAGGRAQRKAGTEKVAAGTLG